MENSCALRRLPEPVRVQPTPREHARASSTDTRLSFPPAVPGTRAGRAAAALLGSRQVGPRPCACRRLRRSGRAPPSRPPLRGRLPATAAAGTQAAGPPSGAGTPCPDSNCPAPACASSERAPPAPGARHSLSGAGLSVLLHPGRAWWPGAERGRRGPHLRVGADGAEGAAGGPGGGGVRCGPSFPLRDDVPLSAGGPHAPPDGPSCDRARGTRLWRGAPGSSGARRRPAPPTSASGLPGALRSRSGGRAWEAEARAALPSYRHSQLLLLHQDDP